MSEAQPELEELDPFEVDILRALAEHDGEATSTEIRNYLGVDGTTKLNYRVREKLEPAGYIDTHQPAREDGRIPPKIISLSETGREVLEVLDDPTETRREIADRVGRLEEQIHGLREENQELREQNERLRELVEGSDVGQIGNRVAALEADVDELQSTVRTLANDPLLDDTQTRADRDSALILSNACKRLLIDEMGGGEERVEAEIATVKENLEDQDALLELSERA
jgi:DNA-binding PadR family transcriptional regulator